MEIALIKTNLRTKL